mgnify:CR=1 FL=1
MTNEYTRAENQKRIRSWLILMGVIFFVVLVALFKDMDEKRAWLSSEPASAQLQELQAAGEPALVYFHSPDCSSCNQVKASLDEVYPTFKNNVTMLEVDVTDMRERDLVEQTGVQTTPTLLLVDAGGNVKLIVGEISPQDLRGELEALIGGAP